MIPALLKILQHPESSCASCVTGPRYLVTTISFINLLISLIYLLTNLRLGINPSANLVQIGGSLITLACLRLFRSHGPGIHVFLGMAVLNACSLVYMFIDFPYTIVMWMPVFTILAVYMAGMVGGGLWSLVAITGVALIMTNGKRFNPSPVPIEAADLPLITVMTLYLTGATAFIASMFFARSIRHLVQIEQKQNEELQQQNQTIQAYAQDKAMLVSIVVHDIATPLTIIMHACHAAQKSPEQASQSIIRIQKAARMMQEIALSVREYQSVESGKSTVHLEAVDLREIFERTLFNFEDRLREKSLSLNIIVPEGEALVVMAEAESLANSVINNLIGNAIKFSHPGQSIEMHARTDGEFIELKIRDFGIGISGEKIKTIFSKRGNESSPGTQGEKGTGYGLPIARAYCDKYGADIRVESIEQRFSPDEHGTTIILKLRRVPSRSQDR